MKTFKLKNGLQLVIDTANTQMFYIEIAIKNGPVYENPKNNGVSHFVEHMIYKGTKNRTATDLYKEMLDIGVVIEGYTYKDHVSFASECLIEDCKVLLDMLADMIKNPIFNTKEIQRERSIILEEYWLGVNDIDILMADISSEVAYKGSAKGFNVLGSLTNIKRMSAKTLRDFHKRTYVAQNMYISVVSSMPEDEMYSIIKDFFADVQEGAPLEDAHHAYSGGFRHLLPHAKTKRIAYLAFNAPKQDILGFDERVFADVLESILIADIREDKALAYSSDVFLDQDKFDGEISFCVEASESKIPDCIICFLSALSLLCEEGCDEEVLKRAKKAEIKNIIKSYDEPSGRAARNISQLFYWDTVMDNQQLIEKVKSITVNNIKETAKRIFHAQFSYLLCGKMKNIITADRIERVIKGGA